MHGDEEYHVLEDGSNNEKSVPKRTRIESGLFELEMTDSGKSTQVNAIFLLKLSPRNDYTNI